MLTNVESYDKLPVEQRSQLRRIMLCLSDITDKVAKQPEVSVDDQRLLKKLKNDMLSTIEYAPIWIIMAVALALGLGTMIGWRRVATTIEKKSVKRHDLRPWDVRADDGSGLHRSGELYRDAGLHHACAVIVRRRDNDCRRRRSATQNRYQYSDGWVFTLPASIILSGGLYWLALHLI